MSMQYVRLGSTGAKVSRLCLGCASFGGGVEWMLSEADSRPIIRAAIEAGVNFFDTADVYSKGASEGILGRALVDFGLPRDRAVIASKVYYPMGPDVNQRGLSRKHIMQSIDASLKRLGTDYLDLYQVHRFDPDTPMEETLEALSDVVRAGKALYVGASTMSAWQFAKFLYLADRLRLPRFVSMQNYYNLLYREEEREMIPLCRSEGIGLLPWSPLAGGLLAGSRRSGTVRSGSEQLRSRFRRPYDEQVFGVVEAIAQERGVSCAQIGLAWLLAKPWITAPLIGMTRLEHLEAPLRALDTQLTSEELSRLEQHYVPQAVITGDPGKD